MDPYDNSPETFNREVSAENNDENVEQIANSQASNQQASNQQATNQQDSSLTSSVVYEGIYIS